MLVTVTGLAKHLSRLEAHPEGWQRGAVTSFSRHQVAEQGFTSINVEAAGGHLAATLRLIWRGCESGVCLRSFGGLENCIAIGRTVQAYPESAATVTRR